MSTFSSLAARSLHVVTTALFLTAFLASFSQAQAQVAGTAAGSAISSARAFATASLWRYLTVLLVGLFATGLFASAAQSQSLNRQREIASSRKFVFYAPEAFSCKSSAAENAIKKTTSELAEVRLFIDVELFNARVQNEMHPKAPPHLNEAEVAALYGLEQRLEGILAALNRLPPCETGSGFYPVFNYSGMLLGIYLIKTTQGIVTTERFVRTDQITGVFSDKKDPLGFGISIAYAFHPWGNNVVVAPFLSFDYLNMSVNHTFPNGSFLGATSNFGGTTGVKVGPTITSDIWVYAIGGVSALNETLNINFIPVASSRTQTVAGGTLGVGAAFQPSFLQGLGRPLSLFVEYQHTWWQDAQFNMPAASPLFTYNFHREDDTIKFGFLVSLDAPPPAAPSYPVKAPRLK